MWLPRETLRGRPCTLGNDAMTTAIGVLCARVRVEEKQIITALGDAGAVAMPVPPASLPLPPCLAPGDLAALGQQPIQENGAHSVPGVMVDRCANRSVAGALLQLLRRAGVEAIDAGLASTGSRLDVAASLVSAGLPRPVSLVAFSELSGLDAAASVGFPSTLLPIRPGSTATALLDRDTADAVIEHRVVLGSQDEALILVQAGAPAAADLVRVHVVDGKAIAFEGEEPSTAAIDLARDAARVLDALFASIDIACIEGECVVWDVIPVADFRQSTLLGDVTVGGALAALAVERASRVAVKADWEGATHAIALTA
jgi:hypothetical protein